MDPQQADPYQPPPQQPAHDITGQYTPMRNTGQPEPPAADSAYSNQPTDNPQGYQQAVDWARSKISALHRQQDVLPNPVQQMVDQPYQTADQPQSPEAPTAPIAPTGAGQAVEQPTQANAGQTPPSDESQAQQPPVPVFQPKSPAFMPKQQFATFELPEEESAPLAEENTSYVAQHTNEQPLQQQAPTEDIQPASQPATPDVPPDAGQAPPVKPEEVDLGNQYEPMENQGAPLEEVAAPLGHVAAQQVITAPPIPEATVAPANVTPASSMAAPKPAGNLIAKIKQFYSGRPKLPSKFKPLVTSALIGLGIYFLFNSQVLIGQIQYLTNSGTDTSASAVDIASDETVPPDPVIIIPKINVNVPVVYDVNTYDEKAIQQGLERGVVHYHNTALPGQIGNNVIVGHSSNNWWASGQYKFAFVLLNKLEVGDTFVIHYNSKKYIYQVSGKKIVEANDLSVVQPTAEPTATLITCDPPGTALRRLVVTAKQINPNPAQASQANISQSQQDLSQLPSNSPSLWQQIQRRLFGD